MSMPSLPIRYERDGFAFPFEAMSEAEALECRAAFERAERIHGEDPNFIYAINDGLHFLLPVVDALTRRAEILDRVEELLGPDLLVFSTSLFAKAPRSSAYVSWHQDLTYWGLDGTRVVTAWVALSPSTVESGCMRMVPGSHRRRLVAHQDSFHGDNLLSRGQEIAGGVDESEAVDLVLRPGQFSLHNGHVFHGSRPNRSGYRRIGLAIIYVSPAMRNRDGIRPLARLVRGRDGYGHFELAPERRGTMDRRDVETLRRAKAISEAFYYQGTEHRLRTDAIGRAAD